MFVSSVGLIEGASGNSCVEILSCIKTNRVIVDDRIVMNHVDVSSCGMSLWKNLFSNFSLKG